MEEEKSIMELPVRLNKQQLEMIQLLKNPMPEEDFKALKKMGIELLAKQLDQVMENWEENEKIDPSYYSKAAQGHFRVKGK